jgi:uncharacterized protein YeeX (DUF496 family)
MQQQASYNEIIKTINNLKFSEKLRLLNHLQKIIDSNDKTVKKNKNISWLGCLEDYTEIHGDIISPVMD